jgi:hypothetical protein
MATDEISICLYICLLKLPSTASINESKEAKVSSEQCIGDVMG